MAVRAHGQDQKWSSILRQGDPTVLERHRLLFESRESSRTRLYAQASRGSDDSVRDVDIDIVEAASTAWT